MPKRTHSRYGHYYLRWKWIPQDVCSIFGGARESARVKGDARGEEISSRLRRLEERERGGPDFLIPQ
jgi:hypothetical protein